MRKLPVPVLVFALCLSLLCGMACSASADAYQAVIDDAAGLLASGEESAVMEAMAPIAESFCNAGFVTYAGTDSSTTVVNKARAWGRKTFGTSSAFTVFMIDMATRRLGVYTSEPVNRVITTAKANTITDNIYREASSGNYGACAVSAFQQITRLLQGEKVSAPMQIISNILLSLILAILGTYVLVSARMRHEEEVTLPDVVTVAAGAGAAAATIVAAHVVTRKVVHESSGGGHGGHGGGGHGGGGGGSGGSHGF